MLLIRFQGSKLQISDFSACFLIDNVCSKLTPGLVEPTRCCRAILKSLISAATLNNSLNCEYVQKTVIERLQTVLSCIFLSMSKLLEYVVLRSPARSKRNMRKLTRSCSSKWPLMGYHTCSHPLIFLQISHCNALPHRLPNSTS